jgi:hypothetical protein
MRKSTLFVSVVLTTFMLAVLFGVVSAYQSIVGSTAVAAAQPQPTAVVEMVSAPVVAEVAPAQVANLAPEAAAAIASKVLGRTDLYSVEVTQFEGADAYLVTFSSGDIVYLSLDGQVLSISKIAVTVVTQKRHNNNNNNSNNPPAASTGGEHEEHEGGDD